MATAAEIFAKARAQIGLIAAQEATIAGQIDDITAVEFQRPLNDDELQKMAELTQASNSLVSARQELSFVTMQALDTSDELQRIKTALNRVVADLNARAGQIAHIGDVADKISAIADGVSELTGQIQTLVPAGR